MQGGGLDDGPHPMAAWVELLAVEQSVDERGRARVHLDAADDEALDLVHVETLVDPAGEQALRRIGLRPHLAPLALLDLLGFHDQREDAERGLRERLRARRAPCLDAHVGLGFEVFPARRGRAHLAEPRSPKRAWSTAIIAGPAVSVLRMRGPTPTIVKPPACALSTSSRLSPPSGPTRSRMRALAGRLGGRLAASVCPDARSAPGPGSTVVAAPSQRQSWSSAGSSRASKSASDRGALTVGMTARPHCLAASAATRCQRRARSRQRPASSVTTVRAVSTGTTCATPSSVDARTIASILSPLGTDCTRVLLTGDSLAPSATPSTVPVACSPTVSRRTVYSRPVPSAASTVSPERSRNTRER